VTLGGTVNLGLDRRKFAAVLWRRTISDFETRLKDVSHAAWLIWTANGLGLDDFGLEQTSKSATDAANNAYVEGKDWVDDTLMRLRGKDLDNAHDFDRRPGSDWASCGGACWRLRRLRAGQRIVRDESGIQKSP
jgi:hypothetical protein